MEVNSENILVTFLSGMLKLDISIIRPTNKFVLAVLLFFKETSIGVLPKKSIKNVES